jgi:integrase
MARPATGQVIERDGARGATYALRFRAYGKRRYITIGSTEDGWTRDRAEVELANVLADVRRGIWREPEPAPTPAVREEPTFHEFASEWVARREHEVGERTREHWRWTLSVHLLPTLKDYPLSEITVEVVDRWKAAKVLERQERERARAAERGESLPGRGLSNSSVNKCLKVLAQILDDAVAYGYLDTNPARGRRLKAGKPRRTWLDADEVADLLDAARDHRALLATMTLGGLRVNELAELRWRAVDLASGRLRVERSKTDAGGRTVDLSPGLREDLTLHRSRSERVGRDDFVFATRNGTKRNRSNITRQILAPAVVKANQARENSGRPPIREHVTNHSLRRTFASLLYEAGASPAYVMSQMGHTSAALALEVYARKMERTRDTGARMDALIRGADWAQTGTNHESGPAAVAAPDNEKAAFTAAS